MRRKGFNGYSMDSAFGLPVEDIDKTLRWESTQQKIQKIIGDTPSSNIQFTYSADKLLEEVEQEPLPVKPKESLQQFYNQPEQQLEPEVLKESAIVDSKIARLHFKKMMGGGIKVQKLEIEKEEFVEELPHEFDIHTRSRAKEFAEKEQMFAPSTDSAYVDKEGYKADHPEGPTLNKGYVDWIRNYPMPAASRKGNDVKTKNANAQGLQDMHAPTTVDIERKEEREKVEKHASGSYEIHAKLTPETFEEKTEQLFRIVSKVQPTVGLLSNDKPDVSRTLQGKEEVVKQYIFRIAQAVVEAGRGESSRQDLNERVDWAAVSKQLASVDNYHSHNAPLDMEESIRKDIQALQDGNRAMFIADSHGMLDHSVWDLPRTQRDLLSIELGRLLQGKNSQGEKYLRGVMSPNHIKPDVKQYVRRGQRVGQAQPISVKPSDTKEDFTLLRQRVLNSYQELAVQAIAPTLEIKEDKKENTRKQLGTIEASSTLETYEKKADVVPDVVQPRKARLPPIDLGHRMERQRTTEEPVREKKNWSFFGFSFPS